jgi:hypothetical protein
MERHKRGAMREDGKIFLYYVKGREYWATPERFAFIKNRDVEKRRLWRKQNPELAKKTAKEWAKKNTESLKNTALKRQYGLTRKEYLLILKDQNGKCSICRNKCKTGRDLSVDHCHKTKKIRGLLCGNCNRGIGLFLDSPILLQKAIYYLEINS